MQACLIKKSKQGIQTCRVCHGSHDNELFNPVEDKTIFLNLLVGLFHFMKPHKYCKQKPG